MRRSANPEPDRQRVLHGAWIDTLTGQCGSVLAGPVHVLVVANREQKVEFLEPAIKGEKIAALGVTEPNAGSDVAGIETAHLRGEVVGRDVARRDQGVRVGIDRQPVALLRLPVIRSMPRVINEEAVILSEALAEMGDGGEDVIARGFAVAGIFWLAVLLGLAMTDPLTRTIYAAARQIGS